MYQNRCGNRDNDSDRASFLRDESSQIAPLRVFQNLEVGFEIRKADLAATFWEEHSSPPH